MPTPTPTLERMQVRLFQTGLGGGDHKFTKNADGTATVEDLKVFKAGTFRDSLGYQNTWEPEHLAQMVFHYDLLRERGVLPNVPVRADHSVSVDKVVGWLTALRVTDQFLRADFKFTEPDAVLKFERGTYLNRSAEIGLYETNDEAFFWPVFLGFAFVDLGAVEGLYAQPEKKFTVITDKETPVPDQPASTTGTAGTPSGTPAPAGLFARATAGGAEQPIAFSIGGQRSTDPVAVQSHITVLEAFQSETNKAARQSYVKQLASDGKIPAPQVQGLTEFAEMLNPEQYDAFTKTWDAAPKSGLFEKHGNGTSNTTGASGTSDAAVPTQIEELEAVVAMHRRSKTPNLENLESFKRLAALKANQAKS